MRAVSWGCLFWFAGRRWELSLGIDIHALYICVRSYQCKWLKADRRRTKRLQCEERVGTYYLRKGFRLIETDEWDAKGEHFNPRCTNRRWFFTLMERVVSWILEPACHRHPAAIGDEVLGVLWLARRGRERREREGSR